MPVCYDDKSYLDFLVTGAGAFASKKILVEGDSWTSHPQLHNLARALDYDGDGEYAILNLSRPGDMAHNMFHMSSSNLDLLKRLLANKQFGYRFDLILLSAGGNDIVGPEIRDFLLDKRENPDLHGTALIKEQLFTEQIPHIVNDYRTLLNVIGGNELNMYTPVVTHSYCYLQPRRIGTHFGEVMFNDGWIARYMEDDKGIEDRDEQLEIIVAMLTEFHNQLVDMQREYYNFLVVDTLDSLSKNGAPDTGLFHDEIHPNLKGFKKVFRKIKSTAQQYNMWV